MGFLHSQFLVTPPLSTTSCAGQTIIVTGANVGLGKEAARHFARLGAAKIILAVRNRQAGEAAKKDIETTTQCADDVVEVWDLDLASNESIKSFAKRASELPRLDCLLENAGIAKDKWTLAAGHESMITINVISTFLLALLILPKLKASAKLFNIKPRLVIVTSGVHAWPKFPEQKAQNIFEALDEESKALMGERYPTSKLLEVLVVRHIAPLLAQSGVILNMVNPGLCHSELSRDSGMMVTVMKFLLARSTEMGSRTLVAAAMAGEESHGKYMDDSRVDDGALSPFVRSEEGGKVGSKVWVELCDILEAIQPGVTGNV